MDDEICRIMPARCANRRLLRDEWSTACDEISTFCDKIGPRCVIDRKCRNEGHAGCDKSRDRYARGWACCGRGVGRCSGSSGGCDKGRVRNAASKTPVPIRALVVTIWLISATFSGDRVTKEVSRATKETPRVTRGTPLVTWARARVAKASGLRRGFFVL